MDDAIKALEGYGYVLQGDRYVRPNKQTQQWAAQADGFLRFDDPGGVPMPYKVREDSAHQQGLDHTNDAHRDDFEWLWPAEEVQRIYEAAPAGAVAEPSPAEE